MPPVPAPPDARAPDKRQSTLMRWIGRFGVAGFAFFLIKGIAWLVVPGLLVVFGVQC